MGEKKTKNEIVDLVLSHLRCIELKSRLLIVASMVDEFKLQAEDVRCLGIFLANFAQRLKECLEMASK